MSHIIADWINNEVKISTTVKPAELDTLFRSGYLFGELLEKLDVYDPSQKTSSVGAKKFINGAHVDALIRNYTNLESILSQKLGIKLSSSSALDLIHGKFGAAAKLLYQIKSALAGLPPIEKSFKKKSAVSKAKSHDGSYPSTPVAGKSSTIQISKDVFPKKIYHEKEHEFFETMLKAKLKRYEPLYPDGNAASTESQDPQVAIPQLQTLKWASSISSEKKPRNAPAAETVSIKKKRETPTKLTPVQQKKPSSPDDSKKSNDDSIHGLERKQASPTFLAKIREAKEMKLTKKKQNARLAAVEDMNRFEAKIHSGIPVKLDNASDDDAEDEQALAFDKELEANIIEDFVKTKAKLNPVQHIKQLARMVPATSHQQDSSRKYLEKIRNQRLEEEFSRKDREQRRRKIILGQQVTQQELEKKHIEDLVLSKLMRQSKQERRIAEQLMQVRHEKEVMHENRVFREQQYFQRRQKDYEEALEKEFEMSEKARKDYREQLALQLQQHKGILESKVAAKRAKNTEFAQNVLQQILNLTFQIVDYRVLNDKKPVPTRKLREWKMLFLQDEPVSKPCVVPLEEDPLTKEAQRQKESPEGDELPPVEPEQLPQSVRILDEKELEDYIRAQGNWSLETHASAPHTNSMLGTIVNDILTLVEGEEETEEIIPLPSAPLKFSIVGKKFAGKSTLANHLAERLNMSVLRIQDLIKAAIAVADPAVKKAEKDKKDAGEREKTPRKLPLTKAQIGARIELSMLEGQSPDDSLLVSLIVEVLCQEPVKPGGWLLVDFPTNRVQAQLLEKELTGYEEPKASKKGDLKRKDKATDKSSKTKSLIAPSEGTPEVANGPLISGIDGVFWLNIDNETALQRALGERIDPVTGKTYHLESNPPPSDVPGLLERLVPVEDEANTRTQLQYHLAAFDEEEEPLREWFSRFRTLRPIDATEAPSKIFDSAISFAKDIIETKEREKLENESPNNLDGIDGGGNKEEDSSKQNDEAGKTMSRSGTAKHDHSKIKSADSKRFAEDGGASTDPSAIEPLPHHVVRSLAANGRKLPSKEFAEILADQWATIESSYSDALKFSFRSLRREREAALKYFYETKTNFKWFLERPDSKQDLVDLFQSEFNAIEDDLRSDPDAKAELHQRVEELRDKLWEVSDKKREEAEQERISIIDDKWVEDHSVILANIFISMMQAELDRHIGTRQLVADYFKDAYALPLTDSIRPAPKLPPCQTTGPSPIEISPVLISAYESQIQRRDGAQSAGPASQNQQQAAPAQGKPGGKSGAPSAKDAKDKKGTSAAAKAVPVVAPEVVQPRQVDRDRLYVVQDYETIAVDYENTNFPDMQAAYDLVMSAIATAGDHPLIDPNLLAAAEKKDAKRKVAIQQPHQQAAESLTEAEHDPSSPEFLKVLEMEDNITKHRIQRLRDQAIAHFKELRNKGYETYILLDEWIGNRFHSEMDAGRDLVNVIKEAIEAEARLPNQLRLKGDKFFIDFGSLTFEPEPEPRPESPVEKLYPDQFTVLQLLNLSRQFRAVAPNGLMTTKAFVDCLTKIANLSQASDLLPENYANAEQSQFQQLTFIMDPFETGFLSWRKFLLINARILPTPLDSLLEIASGYQSCESFQSFGRISREEFMDIPLWFEEDPADVDDDGHRQQAPATFDRQKKLKEALFYFFADEDKSKLNALSVSQMKRSPYSARDSEAFYNGLDASASAGNQESEEVQAPSEERKTTTISPTPIPLIIKEHEPIPDDGSFFDAIDFLLSSCLDENPLIGMRKAFAVVSGRADGACDASQISDILHHFLFITETTHRLDHEESLDDPYPRELITRIFEEAGAGSDGEGLLTADQFAVTAERLGIKYGICPCFQLDELVVTNPRSRPSSGGAAQQASSPSKT